jgi:hypothetical protein
MAVEYFAGRHEASALTQADVFRMMDRHGLAECWQLLWKLHELPQSAECAPRLKDLACADSELEFGLLRAVALLDPRVTADWLVENRASKLHPQVRELLEIRPEVGRLSTRELWSAYHACLVESWNANRARRTPRFEAVEATLRERAADTGALALSTLEHMSCFWRCDDYTASSEEEAAFHWLSQVSHPDALPILLEAALGEERPESEYAEEALLRCGAPVLEPLAAACARSKDPSLGYYLGAFHTPRAEALLIELLSNASSAESRAILGVTLCRVFSTRGLPLLLDVVMSGEWDPFDALDMHVVAAARAAEWDPPEIRRLREHVEAESHAYLPPESFAYQEIDTRKRRVTA